MNYLNPTTPHFKMEAFFLNPKYFDFTLDMIETFVKEIFSGKDEIQKLKLSERLKNLLNINDPENLEVNLSEKMKLPDEIWLKIIQYLPTKDLFGNMALSCKKFHNLFQDSRAIKFLQVKYIDTLTKYGNVKNVIATSKAIVQLTIDQSGDFDNDLICQAFESNPRLRSLRIKTKNLKAETINIIAKSKIEALDLKLEGGKLGSDEVTALCNIKTLKRLKSNPNGQILSSLANNSIPIEELDFLYAGKVASASLNAFLKSKKDTLRFHARIL